MPMSVISSARYQARGERPARLIRHRTDGERRGRVEEELDDDTLPATSPAPDALLTTIAGAADQTIVIEAKRERG